MKKLLGILAAALFWASGAAAQTCGSLPYVFVNGAIADATQVNANFAALLNCVNTAVAPINSPTFTGTPAAPTPGTNINTSQIATTAFVNDFFAPLNSPAFTGVPTAPTAANGSNNSQIATTAFVTRYAPVAGVANSLIATSLTISSGNSAGLDHTIIYLNSSGVGGQTLAINALSGLTDPLFSVGFCDRDSRRWTVTLADGSQSLFIYPGQCNAAQPENSSSGLTFAMPFQRYYDPGATLFVAAPGSGCTANNDGLLVGSPLCLVGDVPGGAARRIKTDFDLGSTNPSIQLADGIYTEAISINGFGGVGWTDGVNILGDSSNHVAVLLEGTSGNSVVFLRDGSILFLGDLEVSCDTPVLSCINPSQNSTIDLTNVTFGSSTSEGMITPQAGGHADFDGGVVMLGNAAAWIDVVGSGAGVEATNQTITFTGSINITNIVIADGTGAFVDFDGSTIVGAGLSGIPLTIANNGEVRTGGNCATGSITSSTFVPGSRASNIAINGGICD